MKIINKILITFMSVIAFTSCETYGDYDQEFSVMYPVCGEWLVDVYKADTVFRAGVTCYTYETAAGDTDRMWLRMGAAANEWGVLGKVDCNVEGRNFSVSNSQNLIDSSDGSTSSTTFSVSNGTVVLDGYDTASGYKADAIEFTFTNSKYPGETYTIKGFRKTGWEEDY